MTRKELLSTMNLTETEFLDYLNKLNNFANSLTSSQLQFHTQLRQPPVKLEEAAKVFTPGVTARDLTTLFEGIPASDEVATFVNWVIKPRPRR